MNGTRAFIAIELPPEVKAVLSRLQAALKKAAPDCPAKWVAPEGIHLTLCFLGEISPSQVEAVKGVMAGVAPQFAPFSLEISRPGAFPDLLRPQTLWVGLDGELDTLTNMHQLLEKDLKPTGYRPENRSFRPHLTLARVRDEAAPAARQKLGEAISHSNIAIPGRVTVSAISLLKSQLTPGGAIYSRLFAAELTNVQGRP